VSWRSPAIVAVATIAALTLVGHPAGLGLSAVLIALYVVKQGVRPPVSRGDKTIAWWWLLAAGLAAVATVRTAAWVVVPSLLASVALASLASAGGPSWRQVGLGLVRIGGTLDGGIAVLRRLPAPAGRPALRATAIALGVLTVFVPLFATADAAFAHLLDAIVPQESADRPVTRTVVWCAVIALGGALLHARPARPAHPAARTLARIEWALPLSVLVGVFAVFVALQLTTLYGGSDYVLRTAGVTYAEYARTGFAQLIAAAALTLAVIAAAGRWAPDEPLRRILLGALCALTLVVLASAYTRLHLYEDAYGFTRLRLAADAAILWLAGLFVLVLAAGATRRFGWLPRGVVALSATGMLAFALSNPDGRIADRNIDRYGRTGRIDISVLRGLSADAAPALSRLAPRLAACATQWMRLDLREPDGLVGLNLGRARARDAIGDVPAECAGS
jgi:hypothetical protein